MRCGFCKDADYHIKGNCSSENEIVRWRRSADAKSQTIKANNIYWSIINSYLSPQNGADWATDFIERYGQPSSAQLIFPSENN